jgi:hypothetical protein
LVVFETTEKCPRLILQEVLPSAFRPPKFVIEAVRERPGENIGNSYTRLDVPRSSGAFQRWQSLIAQFRRAPVLRLD